MNKFISISLVTSSLLFAHSDQNIENIETIINTQTIKQENAQDLTQMLDTENGVKIDEESLSIRGVGDNSRGISVVDDGVSQTDVSGSFTFDIDTTDLQKLIVYKGPGSIYSVNGTGGVVKANSKSIFKTTNDLKLSYGSYGYELVKANIKYYLDLDNVVAFSYLMKNIDNDYKEHSQKESDRYNFKYGHFIDDTSSIEFSYRYNDDKQNKIQTITQSDFDRYLAGDTILNDGMWVYNRQDTQTNVIDGTYKKYFDNDILKISSFYKLMDKQQYQDGKIKIYDGNYNIGLDSEYEFKRGNSNYLLGFSYKKDVAKDNNQYMYGDVTGPSNATSQTVTAVNSDFLGDVMSTSNTNNNLFALYAKDEIYLNEKAKLELSLRVDRVEFNVDNIDYWKYNGTSEKYTLESAPEKLEVTNKTTLYTPRVSFTYKILNNTNLIATIGHGEQTLSDSELLANIKNDMPTDLDPEEATNYELALKHSSKDYLVSLSAYKTYLKNEIVEFKDSSLNIKYFESAGKTEKEGIDLSLKYNLTNMFYVGSNYSYSNYKYIEYVTFNSVTNSNDDYSGNQMEGIPKHKYAFYTGFKNRDTKVSAKLEFLSSSSYYTDKANTVKYKGYDFVTNLIANYEPAKNHRLTLNINNLFDKRYATNVITTSDTVYNVAAPRTINVSYKYDF